MNIKKTEIATVALLLIAVVSIWQITNVYPEIGILQDTIKAQEIAVKDSEGTLMRLKQFISFTVSDKDAISKFDSILPVDEDKANLLANLDELASASGLGTLKIAFKESEKLAASVQQNAANTALKNSNVESRIIAVSLYGSYSSFKSFLAAVEKNLRLIDVVSVSFKSESSSKDEKSSLNTKKFYSYDVELKTYVHSFPAEENITKLLSSAKFKNFTVKNLSFTKGKVFEDLFLSPDHNIDAGADEIGNQNIF